MYSIGTEPIEDILHQFRETVRGESKLMICDILRVYVTLVRVYVRPICPIMVYVRPIVVLYTSPNVAHNLPLSIHVVVGPTL